MTAPSFRRAALSLLFSVSCGSLFAQTTMPKAWQAFFENNRDQARTLFTQELNQPATAGDALLGLSMLAQLDRPSAEAFSYFQKFYAQSKDPQPFIYAFWDTPSINADFRKKSPAQLAFLQNVAQNKNLDGTINAMANAMIGNHYQAIKQYEKADEAFKNIGSVDNWTITGEFDNISTSGFDRTYNVLTHPEPSAEFVNKRGAKIGWRNVPPIRHDKWVDFTYYNNSSNSIVFGQSFVKADNDTEAQLRIGVSGSVKVWVNDELLLAVPEERNNDLDTYIQSIKLNKGYNRILVQVGASYIESLNFLVRLTDQNGHVLPLTSTAQAQPYTKEVNYVSKNTETPSIAYFKAEMKKAPDNLLPQILLAQSYLRNDQTFEARHLIEGIRKKYPNNTYLNILLLNVFNREDNRTGAETIKETIKNTDPKCSEALMLKYAELYEQKNYDKAAEVVKEIEATYPEQQEFIYSCKINLASANKNQEEVVRLGEEAYPKFPDNKTFVGLEYAIQKQLRNDQPKALSILKKYVENNDDYPSAKDLADIYFTNGDNISGNKVLVQEVTNEPYATGIFASLGKKYYDQQQYGKAEEAYLKCMDLAPTRSAYSASLGKIDEMSNKKEQAIGHYQRALELDPNDYESIHSLRKLQNKKDVYSYFEEPNIDALIRNAPKASDYPDDNSVILNEEVQKVVYEHGGSEERKYLTVKILTQKGIESWKEYSIDYDSWQDLTFETAEVIKANGNKVPAERNENNLVFTNLEAGDVINIRYKLDNYSKAKLSGYFWDDFYFSHGRPYITSKYSLLIAKNQKFNYKFSQKPIEPVKTSADEFDLYVWKNTKQESLQYEDKMPTIEDVANILYLTNIPDWKFIADWYNDIGASKARTDYEVKEVVADLFKGKANLTPMQKVEQIYNYITGNISYSSVSFRQSGIIPQNPSTVLNTRIGDCKDVSTLFVAMCKEAGIKANLVLVKTRDNGMLSMPLPSINFNHCMAKVNMDNKDYYIELTSQYLPFRTMYNGQINSTILDIDPSATAVTKYLNPTTRYGNDIKRSTTITLADKNMVINERTYQTGAMAAYQREKYGELSQKDRMKKIKEAIASSYPDVEVNKLDYRNVERTNPNDTVYVTLDYQLNNVAKAIGGMSIFSLPWSSKISANDLQVSMPRTSGINLDDMFYLDNETEVITVNLPAGKKLVEAVAPVALSNDVIEYSLTPKQVGNKLMLTRTFKLKKDYVPVEKVAEFNTFFKKMVEADNKELAMR
ncbi:transglutaminase superfamily protein [Mucilaginibacter yixingensis]|uniref:Transglutaminase superfamily protein n=1 Tax=Mucilaginibacter yixingensis TaxID=1295612 RepID=A0A2T5JDE1_9SPHI|nr:DUF3857 domain-containing protein [Mucilaginibacter yixingensis]PTQ99791.1 transglutaminase superfamily protein [Mucilaginibacter yixingensis]